VEDPEPAAGRARARGARLTERDIRLLAFVAEHRLVLAAHVQVLLDLTAAAAYARLRALTVAGFLNQQILFHRQPGCYQITRKGLAAVRSGYSQPRLNLSCYQHDLGVAWLWLAARSGAFGPIREIVSERGLRSHDAKPDRADAYGVRLGGYGPGGRERLHYPDLLLVTPEGQRIAVELELSSKGRTRREKILAGYAADGRIDAVLYLVDSRARARGIQRSAARVGNAARTHVQPFRWGAAARQQSAGIAIGRRPAGRQPTAVR
jgi:hypothetical protein